MNQIKKIGILTSGGDCAGLNAVISSVVRAAALKNWTVYGIHDGTEGLTNRPLSYEILTVQNFADTPWPRISGSYLGSLNKGVKPSMQAELAQRFAEGVKELGLDAIIVVGGDGSMNIVSGYCKSAGVKMIGIPKTMDNDTPLTQYSVGFQTACQVCTDAVDNLETTARSHHRALILEVMGRNAGHLAIQSALAGFADVCLVPEIPYTFDGIVKKLQQTRQNGKSHAVIVVSEGIKTESGEQLTSAKNMVGEKVLGGIGEYLSEQLALRCPEIQTRVTRLGHVQRSGNPTSFDRILASVFGAKAVQLLDQGQTNLMVGLSNGCFEAYPIEKVVECATANLDPQSPYIIAAHDLGMYVGEI